MRRRRSARGSARAVCALLLALLCVAAQFQGALCRSGAGGGGGGGSGRGGGGGGGGGRNGGARGGSGRPINGAAGAGAGVIGSRAGASGSHRRSDATCPHGRGFWRTSGAAAAGAVTSTAILVWF
ncbi:hypothetical protein GUJ93_ZPchr0010g10308 [Zizania palustris]|uniref:Uncharacterized protein n=1 Tax=Zizania palustris TaxID=103762 RepID=A0A8J6BDC5_ZIZPA|nr:hypothetical protein GUJ93_ZPchr0010g10308 [Zizania palustris]